MNLKNERSPAATYEDIQSKFSNDSKPTDCVEKGHFLKKGLLTKNIVYLKQ
jgi:hypothetical protein